MAIESEVITVTDTPTALHTGDGGPSGARVYLNNKGGGAVTLGGHDAIPFGGGYDLAAGETLELDVAAGDELYAVSDTSASNDVQVMRSGE